jgi:hypothetical protein
MKEEKISLWQQPASFWIGAAMVGELSLAFVMDIIPSGYCKELVPISIGCPLPAWCIIVISIFAYILTVFIGHHLNLGAQPCRK